MGLCGSQSSISSALDIMSCLSWPCPQIPTLARNVNLLFGLFLLFLLSLFCLCSVRQVGAKAHDRSTVGKCFGCASVILFV